jgi:chromosome segregation protein
LAREAEVEAARLLIAGEAETLAGRQQGLYELDNRMKLGEAEVEHAAHQSSELRARAADEREEAERLLASVEADLVEKERVAGELEVASVAERDHGARLAAEEETWQCVKESLAALQARVEGARGEVTTAKSQLVGFEGNERAAVRRRDDLALRLLRLSEDEAHHAERRGGLERDISGRVRSLEGAKQLTLDIADEKQRTETRVAELKELLADGGKALDALGKELTQRRSRHHSLNELHGKYEGFQRGPRAVMAQKETRWGIRDLFADAVDAPAELDLVVEAVLGDRMGAVLVDSQEVGVDVIARLKDQKEGRATFIPINRFSTAEPVAIPPGEGVRGRFVDLVRFGESYQPVAETLFGDVLVVDDLLTALDGWRQSAERPGERRTFVTLEGEVVDKDGVVTGGSHEEAAAGILAQKRELRELEGVIAELESRHNDARYRHEELRQELHRFTSALEAMQRRAHESEIEMLTLEKDLARDREELSRLVTRLNQLGDEKLELDRQRGEAAAEAEEAAKQQHEMKERIITLEDQLSTLGHESLALYEALERAQEKVTRIKVEVSHATDKKSSLERQLFRLTADGDEKRARRARLGESIDSAEARSKSLDEKVEARRSELVRLAEEHARAATEINEARAVHEVHRSELGEREQELKVIRSSLDESAALLAQLEVKRHDVVSARAHLEEAAAERYRIELWREVHDHHLRPLAGPAEEKRARELRDLIERMGEINLHAIEEYNELEERFTFLSRQKSDLEKALAQLEEAIAKINRTSKKRFREVFDLVNQKFQEVFPRCFHGGQARLVLTDEENLLDSGIEIIAQPPGKKNSTVEVLSGGEKAMTAVALIFAIFLIKPSPFCLLDEVDAPLDEANVTRYNELIRDMTDRSQFILITHNKRTMQIADTLYGVTMEEPGISKLVSVNLSTVGKEPTKKRAGLAAV